MPVATRRSTRRSKSCLELRNLFERPVTPTESPPESPTESTDTDSSDGRNSSDGNDEDFSPESFLSTLQETIGCRPRKVLGTPLFDFIVSGNESLSPGWLRKKLVAIDAAKIEMKEKKIMLFIFMSLSGAGWGEDGYSPTDLLSTAWGVASPTIRRACSSALDQDFLHWITCAENSNTESSETDEGNKKRSVRSQLQHPSSDNPSNAETEAVFSPALIDRDPKRRDLRNTPLFLPETPIDLASPASALSPVQSVCSPVSTLDSEEFLSPMNREQNDRSSRRNGTRLDFTRAEKIDATTQTDDDDLFLVDDSAPDESPPTALDRRHLAEIDQGIISKECEAAIGRAVALLFKRKRDAINPQSCDNQVENEPDENEPEENEENDIIGCNLNKILRESLEASANIITLRPFKSGGPLKIMRIKETRQRTGDKKRRKLRKRGHLVEALFANLGISPDEILSILESLAIRRGFRLIKESDCGLDIAKCAALMLYLPATARGLERLQKFMRWALPSIGMSLFPLQLRKKLAKYSIDMFNLKLGFELASLEIGGNTRNERCLHVWIEDPAVAIQRLTQSALVAGKFEESFLFSNHKDEVVIVQGSDRGGDITANLVRLANRSGGNSSQHCLPLAFYEFGKESYFNLKQTIFNPHKPTRDFLQSLLNGEYQMIVVTIHNNSSGAVVDAQCKMLRFVRPGECRRCPSLVRYFQDETEPVNEMAEQRALPPSLSVQLINAEEEASLEEGHDATQLALQLIISKIDEDVPNEEDDGIDDGKLAYKGFALRNCFGRVVCTEPFDEHLAAADNSIVRMRCLQCRCFTSDDIKCNTTLMGQGSASVMCPCTMCVAPKKSFASLLTKPSNQQAAARDGDLANPTVYESFVDDAKGLVEWVRLNSAGRAKALKLKYHSVVYKPLLYTPPQLNTCSGMHVSSGLLTHCTIKMLDHLGEFDKASDWLEDMRSSITEATLYLQTSSETTDKLRKDDARLARDVQAATTMGAFDMIQQLQGDRDKIGALLSAQTKARDAAKFFVEKGKEFLAGVAKKNHTRIIGRATYCFRKSFEVDGRVGFRVENSGFELSNGDGIRVLERREKIVERMKRVFDDNNPQMQQGINTLMDTFLKLTELLYRMSVMMKSQRKWPDLACNEFESAAQQYAQLWLSFAGGNESNPAIFNKMHVLVAHIPQFVRTHGMLGRGSEEGFESSHKCIEKVRDPLKCMTSTEDRAHTIYRRIMLQSRPEIERTFEGITEHFTRAKRGPYTKNPSKMKTADRAPAGRDVDSLSLPEGFIQSINGYVIKASWKEFFEYVCFSKVPLSWSTVFRNDDSLGDGCRVRTEFI
ncbi:hypothetical protein SEMRO_227_G092400.1 [Seminavis robusta]|uniref:Uncharacterized protein n=1 Tax=Seminavis robusta TaxID=568900 RepID=A0A9N8DLS5_9STRA|nr:hypothetical protein SEMRO_227_G092400.1 [Seminavis robusta]|eukprot:Sro227_g092400.1 n/a (1329) ;mRNA; f:69472-73458